MKRVYNFSPGPSMLALPVLEQVQKDLVSYGDTGMSVMEMSHRSKMYQAIFDEAVALLRKLMDVPVPLNLMQHGRADYVDSGNFAHLAAVEAQRYGEVRIAGTSRADGYTYVPDVDVSPEADYVHITTNNTIYGTRYTQLPDTNGVPLVADMSSNILSEVYDVTRFGVIYAGAQKNIGPAGLCVLIVREDLLGRANPLCPKLLNWQVQADADSMYNTPNTFAIYVAKLGFAWLLAQGGVAAIERVNVEKAQLLYDFLDESRLFKPTAQRAFRSRMNVTFVTGDADKDAQFVKEATAAGLVNLKGHRSVGGMRASIYNAMPVEGVRALVDFMKRFEAQNA